MNAHKTFPASNFGRPAEIRTQIASFGGMCPVQLSDRPEMVRAGGLEPPSLPVRSRGSYPVERRPHKKSGTGTTDRTWNLLLQRQPLCQLSYPGMAGGGRIERPKRDPKPRGLPLTEPPTGVTGGNRTLVGWFTASRLNHSATATSGGQGGARIRVCWASTSRYTVSATCPNLVADRGVEPRRHLRLVGDPGFEPGISRSQSERVKPFPKSPEKANAPNPF